MRGVMQEILGIYTMRISSSCQEASGEKSDQRLWYPIVDDLEHGYKGTVGGRWGVWARGGILGKVAGSRCHRACLSKEYKLAEAMGSHPSPVGQAVVSFRLVLLIGQCCVSPGIKQLHTWDSASSISFPC